MNDINEKVSETSLGKSAIALSKEIRESGKVKDLVTTEDMTWKNANGLSLKEIESAGNI